MTFNNVYEDARRAGSYGRLGFPGTYHLAFRDLPGIIGEVPRGSLALDFGCGTGRSTRFLKGLGFEATGVDIAEDMVRLAKKADPSGNYRVIPDGDFCGLPRKAFDLVLSAFAFDNIPGVAHREQVLTALRDLLAPCGRIIIVGSRPEVYRNEWASFTTRAFVENLGAKSGEPVRIVMTDVEDSRPVVDLLWTHEDYLALFEATRLHVVADFRPLGRPDDGMPWLTELSIPPWIIYVLGNPT